MVAIYGDRPPVAEHPPAWGCTSHRECQRVSLDHLMTDEIIDKIHNTANPCDPAYFGESHASPEEMRAAADWQLEQVMEWLNRNITHYTDADGSCSFIASDYLGTCKHINDLKYHLQTAMRPEQEDNS